MAQTFTASDVRNVAKLANIPLHEDEINDLAAGFTKTMIVVDQLTTIDVGKIQPTNHVTGLENVMREDTVNEERMFTQEEALANAPRKHNGFFVVDQVIEQEE